MDGRNEKVNGSVPAFQIEKKKQNKSLCLFSPYKECAIKLIDLIDISWIQACFFSACFVNAYKKM